MKQPFYRVFEYVWPQWRRIAVIFVSVVFISVFFAFSFATITPLLTVMMGSEGLHGWADRKICQQRYDIKFSVSGDADITNDNFELDSILKITTVDQDGLAGAAGLKINDWLVGIGDLLVQDGQDSISVAQLLEALATVEEQSSLKVQYCRVSSENIVELLETTVETGKKPFYANAVQKALSVLPRQETRKSRFDAVVFIIVLAGFMTIIRCLGRFVQNYFAEKVVQTSLTNLRRDMFGHIVDMKVGFFASQGASDTVSRLVKDSESLGRGIKIIFGKTVRESAKAAGLLAYAMITAPQLTLIFLGCAPLAFGAVGKLGKKIKRATRRSLQSWAIMLGKLEEVVGAIKVVKVYNRQDTERQNYNTINTKLLKQVLRIAKINSATGPIMEVLGMTAGSAGLVFGAYWVYEGKMESAEFFTLLIVLGGLAETLRKVSDIWNRIQQSNAGAERVYAVIDEDCEPECPDAVKLPALKDKIEFKGVSFSYPDAEHNALEGVSLTIKAGSKVALVGPNGSGKTTLVSLLPRFYDPDCGTIILDGTDISNTKLKSLRDQIGMVTQQVFTFNDTVANNISYGKADATRDEIVAAAKRSFAHEFIEPLPDGYDTVIGEHGSGFSGGQLQRIAIARAILKNPAILIFDEATSQVDSDSEAKIHAAIEEFMESRTSIIIAHRFSTIIKADSIIVFREGKIVDQGTHEELVERCPLYNSLYQTQLIKT